MTFVEFEKIVKSKHKEAEVFSHGTFAGNKINVAIIFRPNGKVYKYNGTYCEVLNRIGIKAIYKHSLENVKNILSLYKNNNGQINIFSKKPMDYTEEIKKYEAMLNDYLENYIIV